MRKSASVTLTLLAAAAVSAQAQQPAPSPQAPPPAATPAAQNCSTPGATPVAGATTLPTTQNCGTVHGGFGSHGLFHHAGG